MDCRFDVDKIGGWLHDVRAGTGHDAAKALIDAVQTWPEYPRNMRFGYVDYEEDIEEQCWFASCDHEILDKAGLFRDCVMEQNWPVAGEVFRWIHTRIRAAGFNI